MSTWLKIVLPAVSILLLIGGSLLWTPDKSRAELELRYLASPQDMMEVADARLHVRDSGPRAAPAVVLLHGMGAQLQTWDGWATILERDFRVVRFDMPGSGLSPPDPHGDYSDARSILLLGALLDRLGIRKAHVIGNSMGGRIAWKFAANRPERVERLVLISPDGFASPGFAYGKKPEVPLMMQAMKYALPKSMLRANLAIAWSNPAALDAATLDRYYDLLLAPGAREAMLAQMQDTVLVDPEPILQKIEVPVLLLWGEDDGMIPLANSGDYLRNLKNARLVRLPKLGHLPQEENAAASIVPVKAFLDEQ